uniref:F-box/SPRY domain-containing protein 1 n=1 Tax=Elaeis guineensis var. tenera TaxID=51953 RepID=A0A6I9S217_ELAGV|nr:F-box/SPRY domain-containing protein 1 [Elaeis guineensis]
MRPSEGVGDGGEDVAAGFAAEGFRESGKDEGTHPPALRAPAHLISRVFSQLDCVDLLNCSLVCKQWYRESAELREGWKNEYLDAWHHLYGLCIKRETHPPSSTCSIRGVRSWCP